MNVGAQILDNFLHILELLGKEIGIVQRPVVRIPVLVLGTKQIDRVLYQRENFMAALNVMCLALNVRAA